jgi:excisionase family DNA binding protein
MPGIIGGDRVYTVQEVAECVLGCSQRTVRDAIHAPDDPLPAVNIGQGKERADYRILESDLLAWMRRRQSRLMIKSQKKSLTRHQPEQNVTVPVSEHNEESFKARRAARLAAKGKGK